MVSHRLKNNVLFDYKFFCQVQVRPDVKFYDICESGEAVSKADSGFIQTPGYPEYYGNNRDCGVTFRAPQEGEKLYVYLIRLSIENNFNNDYVAVYDSKDKQLGRVTGFRGFPSLMHSVSSTNERIQLRFKSDWITTVALSRPKGMLVYFECNKNLSLININPIDVNVN